MLKKRSLTIVGIFVAILVIFFVAKTASIYPFLFQLIFNRSVDLKQTDNQINVLILGIGGGVHEGPNLTDTIILASLNPKNNKVTLVSIPRDLWVPDLTGSVKKINSAYSVGESVKKGGGLRLAEAAVSQITGQNIDYGVRIDFSGFVKAVDIIGGLDINIDNSFDDYQYPIAGKETETCGHAQEEIQVLATASAEQAVSNFPCRYKHIHFDKGLSHMDGETALEFVRSRYASQSAEASDFARSKRQEKIIKAFKDKILSAQTLINPGKIISLYTVLQGSIDTDVKQDEFDDFIRLATKMKDAKIQSVVIDAGDEQTQRPGLLINPPISNDYKYAWTLIPRVGNGNFSEIKSYISCEIAKGNCSVSPRP
jgi:LCP family protein required for cell wall assembly